MKALLDTWARLEPERCLRLDDGTIRVDSTAYGWTQVLAFKEPETVLIDEAMVQHATQEAIEARGWTWRILKPTDGPYEAAVIASPTRTPHIGDTPAEVLLEAYLEALEVLQQKPEANT